MQVCKGLMMVRFDKHPSGACPKLGQIGRVVAGRAFSVKIGGWWMLMIH